MGTNQVLSTAWQFSSILSICGIFLIFSTLHSVVSYLLQLIKILISPVSCKEKLYFTLSMVEKVKQMDVYIMRVHWLKASAHVMAGKRWPSSNDSCNRPLRRYGVLLPLWTAAVRLPNGCAANVLGVSGGSGCRERLPERMRG